MVVLVNTTVEEPESTMVMLRRGINAHPWGLSCVLRPASLGPRTQGRTDTGLTRRHPIGCPC
eukprot:6581019-Ditylum_brightwellii.AAC.1